MKTLIKQFLREGLTGQLNYRIEHMFNMTEEFEGPDYAVIEITIPLAYMDPKYYYQVVPAHFLASDRIYINKGAAGGKSISTKSVRVLKTFKYDEKDEMEAYLNQLRDDE